MIVKNNTCQASPRVKLASFPLAKEIYMAELVFKRERNEELLFTGGTSKNLWLLYTFEQNIHSLP